MKHELPFDDVEKSEILEAAWFAMRYHFDALADYLDLSDEYLGQLKAKMDKHLNQ